MARRLTWSPASLRELEKIVEYLEVEAPAYAGAVVAEIFSKARSLGQLSDRGRRVPEIGHQAIRELFVHNYRVIYKVNDENVEILTIIHASRQLRPDDVKE